MKENYNIESITSFEKEWIRRDEVLKLIIKMIESDDMELGSAKKQQCKRCGAYYGINYYEDCTCGSSDFEEYVCIDKRLILNKLKQKIEGKK